MLGSIRVVRTTAECGKKLLFAATSSAAAALPELPPFATHPAGEYFRPRLLADIGLDDLVPAHLAFVYDGRHSGSFPPPVDWGTPS